jgi:aminoglycoside phosphotransferase (APT) family kinase protein
MLPMTESIDEQVFPRLARKIAPHGSLVRAWPLHGGVSARVTALEIAHADGRTQKLIVRQHGPIDLARNPAVATDEFRLLQLLQTAGLPAPMPCYLDAAGEFFGTPLIVIEYIEGVTVFSLADVPDILSQMAEHLALLHQTSFPPGDLAFLPDQQAHWTEKLRARPPHLDDSLQEGVIRDALEAAWPPPRRNPTALLHGDFWPGNLLWREGRLAGIIDWEDAARGDPLIDLAVSRLDLLWAFDAAAMERFTRDYAALARLDMTNLPYWDLCAALRPANRLSEWADDAAAEARMRERHHVFVAQAFERLPVR